MAWGSKVHVPVPVVFLSSDDIPHKTKIYVLDLRVMVVYWFHPDLINPGFLPIMAMAVNAEAAHWTPVEEPEPTPTRIRLVS